MTTNKLIPIATINLDTPDSAGAVRGVLCYDEGAETIVTLNPEGYEPEADPECPQIQGIAEALDYVRSAWGFDPETWDLRWLCTDPEDYCSAYGILPVGAS